MDLQKMLLEAIALVDRQEPGQEFEVGDLFRGTKWNKYEPNDRRQLGKLFSNAYENKRISNITRVEVARGKANKYRKL